MASFEAASGGIFKEEWIKIDEDDIIYGDDSEDDVEDDAESTYSVPFSKSRIRLLSRPAYAVVFPVLGFE